jgi:hypothetical protein
LVLAAGFGGRLSVGIVQINRDEQVLPDLPLCSRVEMVAQAAQAGVKSLTSSNAGALVLSWQSGRRPSPRSQTELQ